jgi:nitroreductase
MIRDLVMKSRSYRRFYEDVPIEEETLRELVELARLSPSSANLQPLKFLFVNDPEMNTMINEHLSWAGYLNDWSGPKEGERPSAYIFILGDNNISRSITIDQGIAAHSILLGATERGLGGCIVASIKRRELRPLINLPDQYEMLLVVALGKPREEVVIDTVGPDGDIRYWRDEKDIHHVPKRSMNDLVLGKLPLPEDVSAS